MGRSALFHGARMQIEDTHVRPPSATGASSYASRGYKHDNGQSHVDTAFATPYEHTAWRYASNDDGVLPPLAQGDHPMNNDPDPKYRSRVYTVDHAADEVGRPHDSEIGSRTGFRINGVHDIQPGKTGTIPSVNWNAYKAKRMSSGISITSAYDANHDDPPTPASEPAPKPVREGADEYSNSRRADDRHRDQLNIFTGKTVGEHHVYNATAGALVHLHPAQFPDADAFHRDPTTSTIRRARDYHPMDVQLNTVR